MMGMGGYTVAAINGVKKSTVVKKQGAKIDIKILALMIILAIALTSLVFIGAWKLKLEDQFISEIKQQMENDVVQVFVTTRELEYNESLEGAIESTLIPSKMLNSSMITTDSINVNTLKVSRYLPKNCILQKEDLYDSEITDVTTDSSRWVYIDFIELKGISDEQFIDIRIKSNNYLEGQEIEDEIVVSKKMITDLSEDGRSMRLVMSEPEIKNLSKAVMQVASDQMSTYELYVTTYVDPANQPKALVTYNGENIDYTKNDLEQAKQIMREMME